MLTPLIVLLLVPGVEPNEAEQLFRQMETKLIKAKMLEGLSESKIDINGMLAGMMKQRILIGEGNRVRMETTEEFMGKALSSTTIVNGTKAVTVRENKPEKAVDVPEWLTKAIRFGLARKVVDTPLNTIYPPGAKEPDFETYAPYRVSDFKLGKKEKIGNQETQVIQYKTTASGGKEPVLVSLWLDTKTQLPVKRVLDGSLDRMKVTVTQTFTKLNLDATIDPKLFELPNK